MTTRDVEADPARDPQDLDRPSPTPATPVPVTVPRQSGRHYPGEFLG